MFPALLSTICGQFSYQDCRFHVRRRKVKNKLTPSYLAPFHYEGVYYYI